MASGTDVAAFLGQGDDPEAVALAGQALPIITQMARAYTRDNGFIGEQPNDAIEAVIITASARLMANPAQGGRYEVADYIETPAVFTGWTLAELFVLNRYRKRAA